MSAYDLSQWPLEFEPTPWTAEANCAGLNPDLFFPNRGTESLGASAAKAVCRACTVRVDCLEYADRNRIQHGIWGAFTPRERMARRRAA